MPASRPDPSSNAPFPTTRWSRVVAAGDRADPAAREALAELCAAYWYPLYAFVRRKGHPPEEAADLVQGTFVNLLDRDGLAAVAPRTRPVPLVPDGRVHHHLADCRDRDRAAKRGGGQTPIPFDRLGRRRPLRGRAGRRADGRAALRAALGDQPAGPRRRAGWRRNRPRPGRRVLVSRLLPTLTGGRGEVPFAAIAAELGMTEGAVKMAASRLRRRYGEILREEIARTVADPADVEEEVRALFAALAR